MRLTTVALSEYTQGGQVQIIFDTAKDERFQGELKEAEVETGEKGFLSLGLKFFWLAKTQFGMWMNGESLDHVIPIHPDYRATWIPGDRSIVVGRINPPSSSILITFILPGDHRFLHASQVQGLFLPK